MKAGRGGDDVFMPGSPLALRRMAIGAGGLPDRKMLTAWFGRLSGTKPATVCPNPAGTASTCFLLSASP